MTIVCDTSPLLLFARADRLGLLPALYQRVVVPGAVLQEVNVQADEPARQIQVHVQQDVFQRKEAQGRSLDAVGENMGRGERAAIALARELDAELVVLDDEQGRTEARRHGLSITGSIGILIEAKERDVIASMRRELDRLVEEGLWIDEQLYDRVLREHEE
jgi:predicted nucleic acid-binding protein